MVAITSYKQIGGLNLQSNIYTGTPGTDTSLAASGTSTAARSATVIADNMVLTRQRMISNRLGYDYLANHSATTTSVDAFAEYQSNIIEHETNNTLYRASPITGVRTAYSGSLIPPSPYRLDTTVSRGSLFLTSTAGVMKIDSLTHNPIRAGMTKALDTQVATSGTGNGFLTYSKAAYRITWMRTDANGQTLRSDVSSRVIVTNANRQTLTTLTQVAGTATATTPAVHGYTSGDSILIAGATQTPYNGSFVITVTSTTTFTYAVSGAPASPATGTITAEKMMNATLTFTVPWDIQSGDSYEVWRTVQSSATSADPGDDCFLVSRTVNVTAAGGLITFVDTTADSIISVGVSLYTNATNDGALAGNTRPPVCSAVTTYKDYTIYANTALDHQLTCQMIATISFVLTPAANFSTFIITDATGSRTYTAAALENIALGNWQVTTGGLSVASNIEVTTRSLVRVINGDTSGRFYAEYTSGINDSPGIFRIWARSPTTGAFHLNVSTATTGAQFSPVLATSGSTNISTNDSRPNRFFYSKLQEPDSVPLLQYIDVGKLDQPILRVLSVRDCCYIVKSDGIYYISGLEAPFSLTELDTTARCLAANTAVTLNNSLILMSNQGVIKASLSGVSVVSFDIEPAIMREALPLSNLSTIAFAVGHETDRHYYLFLPTASSDTHATIAYVYHIFTNMWVKHTKPALAGIALNTDSTLYLSSGLEPAVLQQRRTNTQEDYSDESVPFTMGIQLTDNSSRAVWSSTTFPAPLVGMSVHQSGIVAKVTAVQKVSPTLYILTYDRATTVSVGNPATARMPIPSHVRLSPNTAGEGSALKAFYSVTYQLVGNTVSKATIETATNEGPTLNSDTITRVVTGGWGSYGWGDAPWGDQLSDALAIPWSMALHVPDMTGESVITGFSHAMSMEGYSIALVGITYDNLAEYEVTA